MQFTAKLLGGKDDMTTLELLPEVHVRHLKRKIADELLLPCGSFKVLNAGKPLHGKLSLTIPLIITLGIAEGS
ncbi:hypothetical protein ANCDUO_09532 [Ancylostoma duodenale]|uniref:Ubiquitin-like domain-containing protein n=1 Tax=Ancylostoma duodenale TaxID=51022 RepID=A0A0C2CTL2_9BILA|nr:hypothetical protein ANCDUO_09532 [Ancylostoma duodenale]